MSAEQIIQIGVQNLVLPLIKAGGSLGHEPVYHIRIRHPEHSGIRITPRTEGLGRTEAGGVVLADNVESHEHQIQIETSFAQSAAVGVGHMQVSQHVAILEDRTG